MINYMYNTNIELTYNTIDDLSGDTIYRKELLETFNLKTYNEDIINIQDELFEIIKGDNKFKELIVNGRTVLEQKIPLEHTDKTVFSFLFSYDYFYLIHPILADYLIKNEISDNNFNILNKLLKKNI